MNIYIYSDESGVFDKFHNNYFAFGGLVLLGTDSKNEWSRRYAAAEEVIRKRQNYSKNYELKATQLSNQNKGKLYRSLNKCYKFGVIIEQARVLDRIFSSKKDKQRYLDYAYKIAVKRAFERLINQKVIASENIERIYFYADEHNTATNGHYELREGLEQEFKNGTYNFNYNRYYPPLFPSMKEVQLKFCNSKSQLLIRAADIVANRVYFFAQSKKNMNQQSNKLFVTYLP